MDETRGQQAEQKIQPENTAQDETVRMQQEQQSGIQRNQSVQQQRRPQKKKGSAWGKIAIGTGAGTMALPFLLSNSSEAATLLNLLN